MPAVYSSGHQAGLTMPRTVNTHTLVACPFSAHPVSIAPPLPRPAHRDEDRNNCCLAPNDPATVQPSSPASHVPPRKTVSQSLTTQQMGCVSGKTFLQSLEAHKASPPVAQMAALSSGAGRRMTTHPTAHCEKPPGWTSHGRRLTTWRIRGLQTPCASQQQQKASCSVWAPALALSSHMIW